MPTDEKTLIDDIARRNGVSADAVRTVLDALRRGHGTMAQFSHKEFGGMAQWSNGMTMVGDMFNDRMKATLNDVARELADHLRTAPKPVESNRASSGTDRREDDVSYRSTSSGGSWWPDGLGSPSSTGSQNHLKYAVFPGSRRLAIEDGGKVTVYDTGDHAIGGAGQSQGAGSTITFTSQHGTVKLSELKKLDG